MLKNVRKYWLSYIYMYNITILCLINVCSIPISTINLYQFYYLYPPFALFARIRRTVHKVQCFIWMLTGTTESTGHFMFD